MYLHSNRGIRRIGFYAQYSYNILSQQNMDLEVAQSSSPPNPKAIRMKISNSNTLFPQDEAHPQKESLSMSF